MILKMLTRSFRSFPRIICNEIVLFSAGVCVRSRQKCVDSRRSRVGETQWKNNLIYAPRYSIGCGLFVIRRIKVDLQLEEHLSRQVTRNCHLSGPENTAMRVRNRLYSINHIFYGIENFIRDEALSFEYFSLLRWGPLSGRRFDDFGVSLSGLWDTMGKSFTVSFWWRRFIPTFDFCGGCIASHVYIYSI